MPIRKGSTVFLTGVVIGMTIGSMLLSGFPVIIGLSVIAGVSYVCYEDVTSSR